MLSIEALDGFLDKLGDLLREDQPLALAIEATELLTDSPAQRFLMQRRAAFAADAHYLDGVSLHDIAKACDKTAQAVRLWLKEYGPTHYLTIAREDPRPSEPGTWRYVLRPIAVEDDDKATKRKLRQQVAAGRRIVPARRDLVDDTEPAGYRAGIDAEALWHELAAQ